jgi:uncharacterized Zn finger protein
MPDTSIEILINFENKIQIECDSCGSEYLIYFNIEENGINQPAYCCFCGTETILVEDVDEEDYILEDMYNDVDE